MRRVLVSATLLCAVAAHAGQPATGAQELRNAHVRSLAKQAPRGFYPRGFSGQQSYWTVVGTDGGRDSGLFSEDGALEIGKGGFSIEPFLLDHGEPVTWADVAITHTLGEGHLPIPSVVWKYGDVSLRITAFGAGTRVRSQLLARYEVRNDGDRTREVTLMLAVRPLQVDPPTQFLNAPGGVSPIHDLAWRGAQLFVDGRLRVRLLRPPDAAAAGRLEDGPVLERPVSGRAPRDARAHDEAGYAAGAVSYRWSLAAHAVAVVGLIAPLAGPMPPAPNADAARDWLDTREARVAAVWHDKLDRVALRLPPSAPPLADILRSSLAWILISRDGPVLRPGTRSYARSWIRDGTMMADALLRTDHADAAREYALWYAPHQFGDGKVPCCVDARGADPTPENDSPGEFLHLVAQVYHYSGNRVFLRRLWPHVQTTVDYLQRLRESERGPEYSAPPRRMFRGLLPASISHEGYSAHPQHSYWDDFWGLTGYRDAAAIAQALAEQAVAARWTGQRDQFRADLYASLRASIAVHRIDYIPGSAELGDFDPTSTTIALAPGAQLDALQRELPAALLRDTFERYWRESLARAQGRASWDAYTPYEWRNVGAFARLGWRARIPVLLAFFLDGRRPAGWNQWAEVVGRNERKPRFIGDMPHAWVASDCIRSLLDLFAYSRGTDRSIVLAAGVQPGWLEHGGIALHGLRTPYGVLGYTLRRDGTRVTAQIDKGLTLPPGGLALTWPLPGTPGATTVNGRPAHWMNGELHLDALPARVAVETDIPQPATEP